jgi:signal transduction histidine kinase
MLEVAHTAMGAVRRILNDLRPGVLDHLGLWAAIETLLQDVQLRSGLRCTFSCQAEVERCRLGRDAEIALYRIVQEVLTNAQRHAGANMLEVSATAEGSTLVLRLRDDGCGMRVPAQPTSFGLLGMFERAHALGGHLAIDSAAGQGTSITLHLPDMISATRMKVSP